MRIGTVVAVAGLAAFAAGCGSDKCKDESPPVRTAQDCTAVQNEPVTVRIGVCPKCNQATPTCLVHMEAVAQGQITLEPVSEVCDDTASCPVVDPASCQFAPLDCTFTAPPVIGGGASTNYDLVIARPDVSLQKTLTVIAAGPESCSALQ